MIKMGYYMDKPARLVLCSSSSSVDQLDAGRRPLCPIHYVDPFLKQIKSIIS